MTMSTLLEHLNRVNDVPVLSVHDAAFVPYGRVIEGYDFDAMAAYLVQSTEIPAEGNVYVASVPDLEALPVAAEVGSVLYGGMPIQVGYCNGRNTTWNGFEYHKGSEINVVVTDCMLILGHTWQIVGNSYGFEDARVFFVPSGTAIEMSQTTLHLSPCRVSDEGFRAVVILPKGTNTPIEAVPASDDPESVLLLQRNKWVIAHPEREPLVNQGAHPGLRGENKELHY